MKMEEMKAWLGVIAGSAILAGCMSVEGTRRQLQSDDAAEIKKAESNILLVVEWPILAPLDEPKQYVDLVESNELLVKITERTGQSDTQVAAINRLDWNKPGMSNEVVAKILKNAQWWNVQKAAIDKLDPTKPGTPNELLLEFMGKHQDEKTSLLAAAGKLDFNQPGFVMGMLSNRLELVGNVRSIKKGKYKWPCVTDQEEAASQAFWQRLVEHLSEAELVAAIGLVGYEDKRALTERLIGITKDKTILYRVFTEEIGYGVGFDIVAKRLIECLDGGDDVEFISKVLEAKRYSDLRLKDANLRKRLFGMFEQAIMKMDEQKAGEILVKVLQRNKFWSEYYQIAAREAKAAKDAGNKNHLVLGILCGISDDYRACREEAAKGHFFVEESLKWSKSKESSVAKLLEQNLPISYLVFETLVEEYGSDVLPYVGVIPTDIAYTALLSGVVKTPDIELAVAKRLTKEKIDAKVYSSVKSDAAKKVIAAKMTPELQKQVREANAKAFVAVAEKAKVAARETFELDGFYLGMTWDDMKIVLSHHFPDYAITEARDGDDADSDWKILLPGQSSPFCYADAKEKKVFLFNFGKKMLKKWYAYDVQNYMEWAAAYSREHKIDMQYKMLEKEATVYEPDMSDSYRVWFYQNSYQYRHNTKEYRLTYFAEEKDITVEGGIGGAIIKGLAAPRFRYIRGDPGSLRARIERD